MGIKIHQALLVTLILNAAIAAAQIEVTGESGSAGATTSILGK